MPDDSVRPPPRPSATVASAGAARWPALDALRGAAMLWMAAFHAAFDLNLFRLLRPVQNFYDDPFWTWQRVAIVSLFLGCAGGAQALAHLKVQLHGGDPAARNRAFWRRWLQVALCAVLVSIVTRVMFPRSWVSFGVLHGIAVMLLLLRLCESLPRPLVALVALGALVLPRIVRSPVFDDRWTNGIGLVTRRPITEDWVPVLPWLGVMLAGWLIVDGLGRRRARRWAVHGIVQDRRAPARPVRALAALGRWPLTFYMLHQPLLWGGALLLHGLRGAAP